MTSAGGLSPPAFSGYTGLMSDKTRPYLTIPRLSSLPWLVHGFGTAGWQEDDLRAAAGFERFRPVIMRQVHSDAVHRIDAAPEGRLEGDALMTRVPGLLLVVRTADCLPVFLVDERSRAVAAVHCGWRGTAKRVLEKAARAMERDFGAVPGGLLAAIGPCIGSTCYEVGPEVRTVFLRAGFPEDVLAECPGGRGRYLLDLRAANTWLLEGLGLGREDILDTGPACTHCELSLLSYRRDRGEERRMVNFIGLLPPPGTG
jgi:polyphenol oxidase